MIFKTLLLEFVISVVFMLSLILMVAYFTLLERKVISAMQARNGPDKVGLFGIIQPIADALKLLFKEFIIPQNSMSIIFLLAPFLTLTLSLLSMAFIPLTSNGSFVNTNFSLMWVLAISSVNVYSIFISGFASNSKYAIIGSIRSILQMISYELSLTVLILPVLFVSGSLNLITIVNSQLFFGFSNMSWMLPNAFLFFICILAETNRAPFDLPEAEAELVAGYNVEYSSLPFAFFFLGEYLNILIMAMLFSMLFLGGWGTTSENMVVVQSIILFSKTISVSFLIVWVRATLPRVRYDTLMNFCWKYMLLFSTSYFIFFVSLYSIIIYFVL